MFKGYEDIRHGGQDTGYLDQTQSRAKGHTDQAGFNQQVLLKHSYTINSFNTTRTIH